MDISELDFHLICAINVAMEDINLRLLVPYSLTWASLQGLLHL